MHRERNMGSRQRWETLPKSPSIELSHLERSDTFILTSRSYDFTTCGYLSLVYTLGPLKPTTLQEFRAVFIVYPFFVGLRCGDDDIHDFPDTGLRLFALRGTCTYSSAFVPLYLTLYLSPPSSIRAEHHKWHIWHKPAPQNYRYSA